MITLERSISHALHILADASEVVRPDSPEARQLAEAVKALESIEVPTDTIQ